MGLRWVDQGTEARHARRTGTKSETRGALLIWGGQLAHRCTVEFLPDVSPSRRRVGVLSLNQALEPLEDKKHRSTDGYL